MSPAANSTRWCPTPEQLMMLEEMYRAGIRTPNASQIQHITGQLSFYGKIEGKNVFYWFQNHKARDRQKLRRKLCKQLQQQQLFYHHQHHKDYHNNYHNYPYYQKSLLGCLDQTSTCHHNNNFSSASSFLPPQVAGIEDTLMNYSPWKMEMPADQRAEMEKSEMSTYGRDWMMMMMDVGPPSSSCCTSTTRSTSTRPPIKTLQLFPITPSDPPTN